VMFLACQFVPRRLTRKFDGDDFFVVDQLPHVPVYRRDS
jgi:hypothetical protein